MPAEFKEILGKRMDLPDVILIMAHGSDDAILTIDGGKFKKIFTVDETNLLMNNFVFAFSCYTTKVFGASAIEKGAITYIGFDDTIEKVFTINTNEYKDISSKLEIIIKRIYMNNFSQEFEKFIRNCYTANELYQRIMLKVNSEIVKLIKMAIPDLNTKYDLSFKETDKSIIVKIIKLELASKFDYINEKMRLLGDKNYIPWFFINTQSEENLSIVLEKIARMDQKNNRYRYFIESLVKKSFNKRDEYEIATQLEYEVSMKVGEEPFSYKLFAV